MTDRGSVPDIVYDRRGTAIGRAWDDIRHSRGKHVANSRPVPEWVRRLAWILDDAVAVPGTGGRRIGVDGIVAFVPVVGDAAGIVLGSIIVVVGVLVGVSIPTVIRMVLHVALESLVGLIPFVGAVFDAAYKANNRNLALIEADLADRAATRRSSIVTLAIVALIVVGAILFIVGVVVAAVAVIAWLVARWF